MSPKTLQYLMGHSDIGVTLNTYTHLNLEDAEKELEKLAKSWAEREETHEEEEHNLLRIDFTKGKLEA